jgi:peptidylamidoglycolate lyase
MIKKLLYILFGPSILLCTAYLLQPVKKGKGIDATIKYELVENWPNLPANVQLGNPTGIDVDTSQQIVLFHRANRTWPLLAPMPGNTIHSKTILIIDKNSGKLVNSWGDDLFIMPHGLTVDKENNVWVTDVALHQVFKFSHDGKLLMKLGEAKVAGKNSLHFNKPTDIAIAKDGSFYVSDGYGNSRIVKFSATGKYLLEWGKKGNKEGEFDIPHGITVDENDHVYVADRENNRIQEFDPNGKFIRQFTDRSFGNICSVAFDKVQSKLFAVDDWSFLKLKHRGSDVFVFDTAGNVQTRFGRSGSYHGKTSWYHDLTMDKDGNIYVCDILGNTVQKFRKGMVANAK